jgi:hypothetical protein
MSRTPIDRDIRIYVASWLIYQAVVYRRAGESWWEVATVFVAPALALCIARIWEEACADSEDEAEDKNESDEVFIYDPPPVEHIPNPEHIEPLPLPPPTPIRKTEPAFKSGIKRKEWNVAPTNPPDYRKFRSCELKREYPSKEEAEQALKNLRNSGRDLKPHRPLNTYQCDFCHKFHVGHVPKEMLNE